MSVDALSWAFAQEIKRSSRKLVLVTLANYSNDSCEAYPSVATLERVTSLERKTILESLHDLSKSGFISDTGKRIGQTGQVKIYQLNSAENGTVIRRTVPKTAQLNGGKNGTLEAETVPFLHGNSAENGIVNSAKNGIQNRQREPKEEPSASCAREFPDWKTVLAFAASIGLAEWKAQDWFNEMESCGWIDYAGRKIQKWQPALTRVKVKWEADGRPKAPPSRNGAHKATVRHVSGGDTPEASLRRHREQESKARATAAKELAERNGEE